MYRRGRAADKNSCYNDNVLYDFELGYAQALHGQGRIFVNKGQFAAAQTVLQQAENCYRALNAPILEASVLFDIANVHLRAASYDHAQEAYKKILKLAEWYDDAKWYNNALNEGWAYIGLGDIEFEQDSLKAAHEYYNLAEEKFSSAIKKFKQYHRALR